MIVNYRIGMSAMIGRSQTAIGRFSGFPAASLPRLRFLPSVVPKSMIVRGFSPRGEPQKFFPVFSRAAGKDRGRARLRRRRRLRAIAVTLPRDGEARSRVPADCYFRLRRRRRGASSRVAQGRGSCHRPSDACPGRPARSATAPDRARREMTASRRPPARPP